jgi:hypothetical protein
MKSLTITQEGRKTQIFIDGMEVDGVLSYRLEKNSADKQTVFEMAATVTNQVQVEIL